MTSTIYFDEFIDPTTTGSFAIRSEHYMRYMFAASLVPSSDTTYDIGSGNGYGMDIIKKQQPESKVIGFEVSKALSTSSLAKGLQTIRIDLEKDSLTALVTKQSLPRPQVITAFEILEHINNPEKVLQDLWQLLPQDGTLVLSVPNEKYEPKKKGKPRNKFHKQLFSVRRIEIMLREAGFKKLTLYGQPRTNELYHKSKLLNKLIDTITNKSFILFTFLAKLIAMPTKNTSEKSYSIIIVATKN